MNMPIIYIEEIKTTLLTLFGRIFGFIGGKVDSALNNFPLNSQTFKFSTFISIFTFVRSRRDPEEKIARTDPDNIAVFPALYAA